MNLPDKIEFNLTKPIIYSHDGVKKEAWLLEVSCPMNTVERYIRPLKQGLQKSLIEMALTFSGFNKDKKEEAKEEPEDGLLHLEPKAILTALYSNNTIDINAYLGNFKNLLLSKNFCLVDGVVELTSPLYEQITTIDTDNLLAKYLNNFF